MKFRMLYVVLMSVAMIGCSSDEPEIAMGESGDAVVTLNTAGQLGEALGAQANEITKLTVRGPINADDFKTMWSASFNGQLSVIDLSSAAIEGNAIPAYAFYHPDIQNPINGLGFTLKLEQIILPEGISKIGASAFEFAQLTEVSIPSTVETIEKYAFSGCFNLISVSLPSSIKNIREYCFSGCPELRRVYIPSSLESLDKELTLIHIRRCRRKE
ncbi:MAG: leucine-rich repeat domain-containing protein, partial [Muribaculaceae bacterium]|nr:leucine-rich repeat domain-containing protein [Muribaculaceae bacterium]